MYADTGPLKGQVSADKLSIFLAFHLTAKQRKEGKLDCVETLKRHGDGGYDSPGCKQVLHAQTCGSFISKAEWLNGHRVPAEWTSPAERCRKSPGHGQIRCGYEFLQVSLSYWTCLKSLTRSWIQMSVFSGQHSDHKPIVLFVAPLS